MTNWEWSDWYTDIRIYVHMNTEQSERERERERERELIQKQILLKKRAQKFETL